MINFDVTKTERKLIELIAERAFRMARKAGIEYPMMDAEMDLTAVHRNGNPLRLKELLTADVPNFTHDVFGILRHIDRTTGALKSCFVPRYSVTPA